MKLFYFHVPKTAGSSINQFFSKHVAPYHFHLESVMGIDQEFCDRYQFLSGHLPYNRMESILPLGEWVTFATFREPVAYVISHLKWVRKLADDGEEARFAAHPKIFQDIALKMKEFDFSSAMEITKFIEWLCEIEFYYFHNTQMHYLLATKDQGFLKEHQVNKALENLRKIDFVGVQESLDSYMDTLSYEFGWDVEHKPKVNVNENNYGFDINDIATREALVPLYEKDQLVYEEAKNIFAKLQKQYQRNSDEVIGYVDKVSESVLVGWVRYKESLQKVKIDVFVDGKFQGATMANKFRQGLKTRRIHPSGCCQFEFSLDPQVDLNKIEVVVSQTGQKLPFSS